MLTNSSILITGGTGSFGSAVLDKFLNTKVKEIRVEQSSKQREINNYLNENRKLFFEKITPILLNYIDELGIEVLLNKDTVALASLGSDITQSAINRINEKLDD